MLRKIQLVVTAVALGVLTAVAPAAATSDESLLGRQATSTAELQAQVDLQLEVAPGGTQISANEVSYDGGRFVVTFAEPGVRALGSPDCPSGWFCFYEYTGFGYPRGKLSDTGWQDLGAYGWHDRTASVHNNTGTAVDFDNHTVGGHENDVYLFCVGARSSDSDVSPHRDRADHVYRYSSLTTC
ncbi:peptidase inhibitor family I36 protein [Saccharothrix stipae]